MSDLVFSFLRGRLRKLEDEMISEARSRDIAVKDLAEADANIARLDADIEELRRFLSEAEPSGHQ